MPVKRRKGFRRHRAPDLQSSGVYFLYHGQDFFSQWWCHRENAWRSSDHEAQARALWEEWREVMLRDWIAHYPGTRPHAWWTWDAPEPRKLLEGEWSFHDAWPDTLREKFKSPRHFGTCSPTALINPAWETEYAFLQRHKLLTSSERGLGLPLQTESSGSCRKVNLDGTDWPGDCNEVRALIEQWTATN